jgi:hypothetical protein
LKEHPLVLSETIPQGHFVAAEFPFGTDFRADFVVLGPFSGGWSVHFIELEPPNVPLFTRAGKPAKHLVSAVAQIDSWRTFIEKNRACVLRELSKYVQKHELIYENRSIEPLDHAGWPLHHPESALGWEFKIVIGRLKNLAEWEIGKKGNYEKHHGIEVITYDRLIQTAEKYDSGVMPPWKEGRRV